MRIARPVAAAAVSLALILVIWIRSAPAASRDELQRHRNLGKAFYENPTTHREAIAEFKKALDLAPDSIPDKLNYALALLRGDRAAEAVAILEQVQQRDPSLPHTWFNLGIYYKRANQPAKAQAQFERLIAIAPDEPIAHYQLGTLYRTAGRTDDAIAQFERASNLDPQLAAAHFQLYNAYRQAGRAAAAERELTMFQELKKQSEGAAIPEDVEWSRFAEIYDPSPAPAEHTTASSSWSDRVLEEGATGVVAIDASGTGQPDLLVWSPRSVHVYRKGTQLATDSGLEEIKGAAFIAAGDFDNDGLMDLCVLTDSGPLLYRNLKGRFTRVDAALPKRTFDRAVWIDYDHDYDLDLLLFGDQPALMRNQGSAGFEDRSADFPFAAGHTTDAFKLRVEPDSKAFDLLVNYPNRDPVLYRDQLGGRYTQAKYTGATPSRAVAADFGRDGRLDFAEIANGRAIVKWNRAPSKHWIGVQLAGVKNLKLAEDAEVEVKAGGDYWKKRYEGVPLTFDVGSNRTVDVVRITWPNGLIQNEVNQVANRVYRYEEKQRLSGSCPMIWTFDGRGFQFITDVLGVAPLGASDGEGTYFPVDHDEYVQISGLAVATVNGHYEIRITEELSEVSYLDQVQLIALDHPARKEIFTNEKFKGPPYPEFRLYEAERHIYPLAAHDDEGRDGLDRLRARDRRYPDQFPERKGGLVMPYLQVQDASGRWITVNEDMGMPAGKPKTIAVPLHFISPTRKLRIMTDLCVYWDEIFLSESTAPAEARTTPLNLRSADLHFRGFSQTRIDPDRKQPDTFLYDRLDAGSFWNPTPGMYTRYGDVRELLQKVDDKPVIMGSGDELRLLFDASSMPPLAPGWTRDFLLKVDGWAKDRDPNTAFSSTVEPLPFHAMSRYPYPVEEHFPNDSEHRAYLKQYNTRPALRLIRPLEHSR
jgi:tetratricopeptide (TPR) repeat protein